MIYYNIKFLTNTANINNIDFRASRSETKKQRENTVFDVAKRSYTIIRGCGIRPPKSRLVREFETHFREKSAIFCDWLNDTTVAVVFSSGVIAYLSVDPASLDVTQILFDRFCVGKLSGLSVCGVVFSNTHLLLTHAEGSATLITFTAVKNATHVPCRIADRNPHLQTVDLVDDARRAERRVSWSEPPADLVGRGPRVLVWTAASNEPAPWSPVPDIRANLHLYQLHGAHMSLVAFHQLENETILAEISKQNYNIIHIVDQVICQKSGVILEWVRYELKDQEDGVVRLCSHRAGGTRVSMPAPARAVALAPCGRRLTLACIDSTIHIAHHTAGISHSTRVGFIASMVYWTGSAVICGEENARLQCFDHALASLHQTTKCVHLQHYMGDNAHMDILAVKSMNSGVLLLTLFNSGSIAVLRLTHPKLPMAWIRSGKISRAVAFLETMSWDQSGEECLYILQTIIKAVLRSPLSAAGCGWVQRALGTYLAPSGGASSSNVPAGMAPATHAPRWRAAVVDLARLFHHHLIRRSRIDLALSLGVELGAWDLFLDARWMALRADRLALADEALELAHHCAPSSHGSECSDSCSCSHSSCSSSGDESSSNSNETKPPPLPRIPPQPAMPDPINQSEPSTASFRPNPHHYLERDLSIRNSNATETPTVRWHSMDDVLDQRTNLRQRLLKTIDEQTVWRKSSVTDLPPRTFEPILNYKSVYQRDLRNVSNTLYRYQNGYPQLSLGDKRELGEKNTRPVEKNVKFSDKVTVTMVPELRSNIPEPARELADSLPICPPHAYLAAFEPASSAHAPGTDYVEV